MRNNLTQDAVDRFLKQLHQTACNLTAFLSTEPTFFVKEKHFKLISLGRGVSRCKIAFMGCQRNHGELASEVILITKLQGWAGKNGESIEVTKSQSWEELNNGERWDSKRRNDSE